MELILQKGKRYTAIKWTKEWQKAKPVIIGELVKELEQVFNREKLERERTKLLKKYKFLRKNR